MVGGLEGVGRQSPGYRVDDRGGSSCSGVWICDCRWSSPTCRRWALARGSHPISREIGLCLKFIRLPLILCDETVIAYAIRSIGVLEPRSLRFALAGPLLVVEASIWTFRQGMLSPIISLAVGEDLFVIRLVV